MDREGVRWSLTVLGLVVVVAGSTLLRRSLWSDDPLMISDAAFRFRLARMYAQGESPLERDPMVTPPEGQPIRNDFLLLEDALVGGTYRLFHPSFDDEAFDDHLALWVALISSLGAVSVFLLGYALWRKRGVALAAALIAAFAVAAVDRTVNVYLREHLALPFILLGWAGMVGALRRSSDGLSMARCIPWLVASGLGWGVALAAWYLSGFVLTVTAVLLAFYLVWRKQWRSVGWVSLVLGAVTIFVGLTVPALRGKGFYLSPAVCLFCSVALVSLIPSFRCALEPQRWRIALALVGGSILLLLVGRLLGVGHGGHFSHVYAVVWDKLIHLGRKPADPAELSWISRAMWSGPFESPKLSGFLYSNWLLLPLGVFGGAVTIRAWRRGEAAEGAVLAVGLAVALFLAYLLFRRFEVFLAPLLALTAAGLLTRIRRWRDLPLVVALVGLASFNLYQTVNLIEDNAVRRVVTRIAPSPPSWPHDIGDELRGVIRWLRANTPPDAVLAARYNIAPMLLAYAGRPIALHSMWESPGSRERARRFTLGQFGNEDDFYGLVSRWGVDYLVISAADHLDTGDESARYEADALRPGNGEVIEALCLSPEELTDFNLVFQTASFRVFAVGKTFAERPFYGDQRAYELAGSPAVASPVGGYSPLFDPGSPIAVEAEPAERSRLLYMALDEYNLGATLYNGGQYDRAAPRFRHVLEEVGDLNRAGYWLSSILFRLGDPVGAEEELLLFGEKCPGDLNGLLLQADILTVLGRSGESLVLLQEAISNLPDEPRLYEKLAELYRDLGDAEQAELLFLRAREVSGDY